MDLTTVMNVVGTWPIEDRLKLVEEIWESIEAGDKTNVLSKAHRQDLQRRLDAYRDHPKAGSLWEDAEIRLRGNSR